MPVDFVALFRVLDAAHCRFVVVGGLALVLHGIDRLTADVDLVFDLTADTAADALQALESSGYRPLAPVPAVQLADPARRAEWAQQRGMQVFSLWDSTSTRPTVDLFLEPPIPFDDLWGDAMPVALAGVQVRVASIPHLIAMKSATGRPRDLADVELLRARLGGVR
jgi:hypothetical protein